MDKVGEIIKTVPVLHGEMARYPSIDPTLTVSGASADARVTGDKLAEHEKRLIIQERQVDATLTVAGASADAKVTGDKFAEMDERIRQAAEDVSSVPGKVAALEKTTAEHTEQLAAQENELDAQAKVQQSQAQTMSSIQQAQQIQAQNIAAHEQSIGANAAAIAAQEKTISEHAAQIDKAVSDDEMNQAIAQALPFASDAGAVHYTPDEKTEEEQAIARGNIAASALVHTHTKSQITDFPTSMTPTAHTHTKSQITDFPTSMTPTSHNQAASTITAGTFAGQVVANTSGQTYSTYCLRNTRLASSETNPTVNGQICWTYG